MPEPTTPLPPVPRRIAWLHFANDLTLDFLTPLLPAGVGVAWIGVMEGAADAVGQVLKLVTGRASDRSGRRVPWVAAGYATNAIARPLAGVGMLLLLPWWIVACRIADRVGKGIRGGAVDALCADWTDDSNRARAFARLRVMDHLGATLGGLLATVAAFWFQPWLGWIVCGLAVVALWVFWLCRGLTDAPREAAEPVKPVIAGWWPSSPAVRRPLTAIAIASLGAKLSPLLVLVQVAGLPGSDAPGSWPLWQVCLGWAALGAVQAGAAGLSGLLTERMGPASFLRFAWCFGAAVMTFLAFAQGSWLIAAGVLFGIFAGLTEGAEKTWLAELAPRAERGVTYGALALLTAGAGLIGNTVCGLQLANHLPLVFLGLGAAMVAGTALTIRAKD